MKIELVLSDELYADLELLAVELEVPDITAVALGAIMQWVELRKAELANRDPSQRYFINEALDELLERQKKSD
ncbi:MAG TPA: hypothetical protein VMT61_00280 [Candidatus Binataceae bacterium]|nr:hypothetical protein [Candidatus Binataceae bacterium]